MRILALLAGWCCLAICGCGEDRRGGAGQDGEDASARFTVEGLAQDLEAIYETYAVIAGSPRDEGSSKMAARRLAELGDDVQRVAERLVSLEVPPQSVRRTLGQSLRETERRIEREMRELTETWRAPDPASEEILEEAFEGFEQKMKRFEVVFEEYFEMQDPPR